MTVDPVVPGSQPQSSDGIILESMGVALMAVDADCRIIRFNSLAEQLTGYHENMVVGQPCADVLRASHCQWRCPVREALQTRTTCRIGTVILQTLDLQQLTVEVTASVLTDGTGNVVGAVGLLREATAEQGLMQILGSKEFVSRTPAMRRIFEALPKLATSQAPVLIVGGCGSGRSALAETIHNLGPGRRRGSLVKIACTGARATERLAAALGQWGDSKLDGGSLLLEDVCGAPLPVQQQLLAWIEDGSEPAPFRLISTATERLETCLRRGAFRKDLFYRLNVLHVAMPDLRQRAEDIPLLAEQFVEELNLKRNRRVEGISAAAMGRLLEADFPANVRQLRMVLDQAHRRCTGGLIEEQHLPELSRTLQAHKAHLEREAIESVLNQVGGSITRAAKQLRMHRTTLWRKIRRFGIRV